MFLPLLLLFYTMEECKTRRERQHRGQCRPNAKHDIDARFDALPLTVVANVG